jgi:glycogen operon protein
MYRDTMRDFWRGQRRRRRVRARVHGLERPLPVGRPAPVRVDQLRHLPRRLHAPRPRLVQRKHNEANLEDNRDGTDDNRSWNCGVEGETDDPEVNELRDRQMRNFLATLLLSQGVPMLLGGDEIGARSSGNNNAYCQDNELSWSTGSSASARTALLEFTRGCCGSAREHPVFRRSAFLTGRSAAARARPTSGGSGPTGAR